ncbi:MAG: histidine kinase [Hyphomicrobium sp.]
MKTGAPSARKRSSIAGALNDVARTDGHFWTSLTLKLPWQLSLRSRLVLSIALTLVISLTAGAAFTYWHAVAKIETEMRAAIDVGGRIAHNAVDDAEEAVDPRRRLELLVADFNGDRHLRASLIIGNKTVQTSLLASPEQSVPGWFYRFLVGAPKVQQVELPSAFDGFGRIVLQTDAHNEAAEVWSDVTLILSVLALFCLLVVVLLYWSLGSAIRPLLDLTAAFSNVGNGDYRQRMSERAPLELMRLCHGFNEMVERLARAESKSQRLQDQLTTVQDEERADLARDLHDEIGPLLFAVDVDAVSIEQLNNDGRYAKISERAGLIRDSVGQMQRHVRDILARLRPAVLLDVGLAHAIDNLTAFWRVHHPGLAFRVDVTEESFGDAIDRTIYRIVQESLSNAVRHGRPTTVEIVVRSEPDGTIAVDVRDDGRGLSSPDNSNRYGIVGMRERVAALDGSLEVGNRTDRKGVIVSARLPASIDAAGIAHAAKHSAQGAIGQ